jgi:hypothetical protein
MGQAGPCAPIFAFIAAKWRPPIIAIHPVDATPFAYNAAMHCPSVAASLVATQEARPK